MKKIISKDLDFEKQLKDILSFDRGVPANIEETVKKIITDKELIKNFPDKIFVPTNVSQESMNQTFNSVFLLRRLRSIRNLHGPY